MCLYAIGGIVFLLQHTLSIDLLLQFCKTKLLWSFCSISNLPILIQECLAACVMPLPFLFIGISSNLKPKLVRCQAILLPPKGINFSTLVLGNSSFQGMLYFKNIFFLLFLINLFLPQLLPKFFILLFLIILLLLPFLFLIHLSIMIVSFMISILFLTQIQSQMMILLLHHSLSQYKMTNMLTILFQQHLFQLLEFPLMPHLLHNLIPRLILSLLPSLLHSLMINLLHKLFHLFFKGLLGCPTNLLICNLIIVTK